MKKVMLFLIACMAWTFVCYATGEDTPKLTKAQKKAIEKRKKEISDSLDHARAVEALKNGYYVLMADRIMIRGRSFLGIDSNKNFLLIQGDEAVIQLAANNGRLGLNGLGGITVEGRVSGLKGGEPDKKGCVSYRFSVSGPAVSAQVQVTLYKDDNQAVAIVSPNFGAGSLTVYGKIEPYNTVDYDKAIKGSTFP